jgi:tripeptide aminopeptidase
MGLPTPNLFTGGHEYHSVREWASLQDMAAAAATIIHLAEAWTRPEYARAADLRSRTAATAARSSP